MDKGEVAKKPRGRAKKIVAAGEKDTTVAEMETPKKTAAVDEAKDNADKTEVDKDEVAKKPRGRAKKVVPAVVKDTIVAEVETPKKGRGRPKKDSAT